MVTYRFFRFIITLMSLSFLSLSVGLAAEQPFDTIARVNDTVLLRQELDREMKLVAMIFEREGRPLSDKQLVRSEKDMRETLINRALLFQKSQAMGIEVEKKRVEKALDQFKAGFADDQAYQKSLADMGFSEEEFIEQLQKGLAIKAVLDKEVIHHITVSDDQVRAYYDNNPRWFRMPEQVKASHILIKVPKNADKKAQAKALAIIEDLKTRISSGENFSVLAQQYSDGPSKAKGGDLGFFTRDQIIPPLSEAAFAMEPGQVSDIIKTRYGYHLIRTIERKPESTMAFTEVKEAIFKRLHQEKEEKAIGNYLEHLRKNADIQRFPL